MMRLTRNTIQQSAAVGADTADPFTEISRGVDHQLWLVESHAAPMMREAADFAKTWRDNPDGSAKIATGPIATLDNVAVWVNERGAGGEVIR
jgi:hypothetical protein